jgi:hypothetical protein
MMAMAMMRMMMTTTTTKLPLDVDDSVDENEKQCGTVRKQWQRPRRASRGCRKAFESEKGEKKECVFNKAVVWLRD